MNIKVDVVGVNKVAGNIKQLEDRLKKKVLVSAYKKASSIVIKAAKARVPVGTKKHYRYSNGKIVASYNPGNLRESIGAWSSKSSGEYFTSGRTPYVNVAPRVGKKSKYDGYYGHMVEYGTRDTAAQPYMRDAYEMTADFVRDRIANDVAEAVNRYEGK